MVAEEKIQKLVNKIVAEYQPEKVILFGSYAWGKPTEDSDVDLLVVKESKQNRRERQIELEERLYPPQMAFDLLVYTPLEIRERLALGDFFIEDVITKGKVLYEAKG